MTSEELWQVMYTNVVNRLVRMFQVHRFPSTAERLLKYCLPPLVGSELHMNLTKAISMRDVSVFEIKPPAGVESILFWVRPESGKTESVSPIDPLDGFTISENHPDYVAVCDWVTKQTQMYEFMDDSCVYLNRMLKLMKHPMWVEKLWPELLPYVGPVPVVAVATKEPRPAALNNRNKEIEEKIILGLTTSALLPTVDLCAGLGSYTRVVKP